MSGIRKALSGKMTTGDYIRWVVGVIMGCLVGISITWR